MDAMGGLTNKKLLVVDDDEKLRNLLKEYLEDYGCQVRALADGLSLGEVIEAEMPDLMILDVMMPNKDGFEVLKDIRRKFNIPVIMLTAKGEDADRIVGLELGADDYVPKPFNPRELLARIKAVLRRTSLHDREPVETDAPKHVKAGGLVLNKQKRVVVIDGREVELSATEYELLRILMERPNRTFTRDELMTLARGRDFAAFDRSIDVHVSNLRAKVEQDPRSPKRIKTVWGVGYMFVDAR